MKDERDTWRLCRPAFSNPILQHFTTGCQKKTRHKASSAPHPRSTASRASHLSSSIHTAQQGFTWKICIQVNPDKGRLTSKKGNLLEEVCALIILTKSSWHGWIAFTDGCYLTWPVSFLNIPPKNFAWKITIRVKLSLKLLMLRHALASDSTLHNSLYDHVGYFVSTRKWL